MVQVFFKTFTLWIYLFWQVTPALSAPDEERLGRSQGYPRAPSVAAAGQDLHIVDSNSGGWETFLPTKRIGAGTPNLLQKQMPPIRIAYTFDGKNLTVDDYLNRRRVTSLLILKDGQLLEERYQYGRTAQHRFNSASMAKSFLGLLVGWALADGHIQSLDDPIERYVPAVAATVFAGIRVKDLLMMSSGLAFEEGNYTNPNSLFAQMVRQQYRVGGLDALMEFKTIPRRGAPGTVFFYSSLDSELLGQVIRAATKKSLSDYLSEKLWSPMGMESFATWQVDAKSMERAHCCIGATARDYAKVGLLLANDGLHQGKQILPKGWVDEMVRVRAPHVEKAGIGQEPPIYGYGLHVWMKSPSEFLFRGLRGQTLYVDREKKIVLVQTAVWALGDGGNNAELEALWRGVQRSLAKEKTQ